MAIKYAPATPKTIYQAPRVESAKAAKRKNRAGRKPADVKKVAVSLRVDPEVIEWFKAAGPKWQSRMNDALRKSAGLPERE